MKNPNNNWVVLVVILLFLLSPLSIAENTNRQTTLNISNEVYLGYASIVGEGNASILEAVAENDLRIKIDSESGSLDFFINFDMTCNGLTDEGVIALTLSLDGENISANVTQTPTEKSGTLFLHNVGVNRGDTFLFVINVVYGNLIPLYHNETTATGAAVVNKNKVSCIDNTPPNPPIIDGPTSGKVGEVYTYEVTVSDPDDNEGLIKLEIDFGDEIITKESGCCGAVWENGQVVNISYKWNQSGNYEITGRVMDAQFEWGNWSDPLIVHISKFKSNNLGTMKNNQVTRDWWYFRDLYWKACEKVSLKDLLLTLVTNNYNNIY